MKAIEVTGPKGDFVQGVRARPLPPAARAFQASRNASTPAPLPLPLSPPTSPLPLPPRPLARKPPLGAQTCELRRRCWCFARHSSCDLQAPRQGGRGEGGGRAY